MPKTWEVRTQFNKPRYEGPPDVLEWSAIFVDTQAEAESWWDCRLMSKHRGRVNTMFDPDGNVVKVAFN